MRAAALRGLLALLLAGALAAPVAAQEIGVIQSDIVIVDTERLLEGSRLGQRLIRDMQAEREDLIARNEGLRLELEADEKNLTDRRAEMTPEAFRALADEFDARVQQIRDESARMGRDLERKRELIPSQFMQQVQPVLLDLLQDANASVMLDRRGVMLAAEVLDVTDLAIRRVDRAVGDGTQPQEGGTANQ